MEAARFFANSTALRSKIYECLGRTEPEGVFTPFSVGDFVIYLQQVGVEVTGRRASDIDTLVARMADQGILVPAGSGRGSLFGRTYLLSSHVTQLQADGHLWLSPVIGPEVIIESLLPNVVHITGTKCGKVRNGSGLLLDDRHVLTAAHVVTDMVVDDVVHFSGGLEAAVLRTRAHDTVDVAIIEIDPPDGVHASRSKGIAFRSPEWADRVTLLGYPPVPQSAEAYLTVQAGEIVNPRVRSYIGASEYFLYSATARPGNSGGPVVAADGRVLGIVTRDFFDEGDSSKSPFFAGVPTHVIVEAINEFDEFRDAIPVETWT